MNLAVRGMNFDFCLVYLDDIVVFSKTLEEHTRRLELLFERLRLAKLKLKPFKCHLMQVEIAFLGHVVSKDGVLTDRAKIEAVRTWPTPTSFTEVRSFLGLASYYRRFVDSFAKKAIPLYRLAEKGRQFEWTDECELAMQSLKEALMSSPVLALPTDEGIYVLDTDASNFSIGAVLSQIQEGEERVIAYASKALSRSERNYCVTRREMLVVVYYMRAFRKFLLGQIF